VIVTLVLCGGSALCLFTRLGVTMFTEGQQVRVIDDECPLHGKIVTIIRRHPKCTAEWEVRTESGREWLVHSCRLRPV
jgi:hypothetical protein